MLATGTPRSSGGGGVWWCRTPHSSPESSWSSTTPDPPPIPSARPPMLPQHLVLRFVLSFCSSAHAEAASHAHVCFIFCFWGCQLSKCDHGCFRCKCTSDFADEYALPSAERHPNMGPCRSIPHALYNVTEEYLGLSKITPRVAI